MSKERPDHHDAELILRLYELRRETVMRQSRATVMAFLPRSYEEILAIVAPAHPANAAWRQVSSYWEMVYSFARHGVVNSDFLVESNAEGLFLFVKVEPHLERFRREVAPTAFRNAEWIATQCEAGRERAALIRARVARMTEASSPAVAR
jgi:hypothetical protein